MPEVTVSINAQMIGDKVMVAGVNSSLRQYLAATGSQAEAALLVPGLEILAIDGETVSAQIQRLFDYVGGSSEDYRIRMAVAALTRRSFLYPQQATSKWRFRQPDGSQFDLDLPWFIVFDGPKRRDALFSLKSRGIPFIQEYAGAMAQALNNTNNSFAIDFGRTGTVNRLNYEVTDLYFMGNAPVVIRGKWGQGEAGYDVIELTSFASGKVKDAADREFDSSIAAIQEAVKSANEAGRNVILDLRNNTGGSPTLALDLFRLFLPEGQDYAPPSRAHRITRPVRQVLESSNFDLLQEDYSTPSIAAMEQALDAGEEYTDPFTVNDFLSADPMIGGFKGKLAILVDSFCISACDLAVAMFKEHKIGFLIGTHSNGTGAGFEYSGNISSISWSDSFQVFMSIFPNTLFGAPDSGSASIRSVGNAEGNLRRLLATNLENEPTFADYPYQETLEHMLDTEAQDGWLLKAHQVMNVDAVRE